MPDQIEKYGYAWPAGTHPLHIEMTCIRQGIGNDLFFHYDQMRSIIWPELDQNRWYRLAMQTVIREKCIVMAGCASSGKSHVAGCFGLMMYWCFPQETCVLVSSTEIRGLKGRIWSEITRLWQKGRDRFPQFLGGYHLDSRVAILTDDLGDDDERRSRDYTKCIQGVPCRESSGQWVGLNRYMGWKQKHMILLADEANQMQPEFINGVTNLNSNPDFKVIIMGNFSDPTDCLGRAAEPVDGWAAHMAPMKTEVWDTFFPLPGKCINFIGFDSPNFDFPKEDPSEQDHYPELIGPKRIAEIEKAFTRESWQFYSQCCGAMKISQLSNRVLTREICTKGNAFEEATWEGAPRTRAAGLDSAWGGDRCVFTWVEFGRAVGGALVLQCNSPELVPTVPTPGEDADYAIARWCKQRCEQLGIPPENFFHDSTGRGSLGTALARVWSAQCNPVEFGGPPSNRPIPEFQWVDVKTGERRPKTWREHAVKFVTELWFCVRYCVESGQLRNMQDDVLTEFSMRIWEMKGDKIELEPKSGTQEKPGMKQRTGRSPDLADSLAIAVEGARRRGFTIARLENTEAKSSNQSWLREEAKKHRRERLATELVEV